MGLERLAGVHVWSYSPKVHTLNGAPPPDDRDISMSGTQLSLLWSGDGDTGVVPSPYVTPRLSFDVAFGSGISVGGTVGFFATRGTETDSLGNASATIDTPSKSEFIFSARAGYLTMFDETYGVWPRLGMTFAHVATTTKTPSADSEEPPVEIDSRTSLLSIDPEVLFVVAPRPNFGLLFGLQVAIGVAGNTTAERESRSLINDVTVTMSDIGLTAGVVGCL